MLKKSLIAIAVLALAMPAMAGSLKVHEWQCEYVPQAITTIDVLIDVGYYIVIDNQDAITLEQEGDTTTYSGTYTSSVFSNFDATLSVKIVKAGVAIKTLTATFSDDPALDENIPAGDSAIEIAIKAVDVAIEDMTAATTGQKIAEMTISVKPAA